MSWDVVIFNLSRKVQRVEEIDEAILVDIGTNKAFFKIIKDHYPEAVWKDNWVSIERGDHSIEFGLHDSDETFSNIIFHLYGENAVYDVIELCKKQEWQIFDTGLDQMLDLENPANNGYEKFQEYLHGLPDRL